MRNLPVLLILVLLTGCQSAPKPVVAPVVVAPPAAPTETPLAPEPMIEETPVQTAASQQASAALIKGGQAQQVFTKSAFARSRQFTSAGWSGVILSPKDLRQGIVCSSEYKIQRVEIHPLADGRLRIWIEVANVTNHRVLPEAACEFRPSPTEKAAKFRALPPLESQTKALVYFESDQPQMEGYSILVRSKR